MSQPEDLTPATEDPTPITSWPAPPPEPVHKPNKVFFGRFGFRAGWGVAIFVVVVVLLQIFGGIVAVAVNGQLKEAIAIRQQAAANPHAHIVFQPRFTPTLVFTIDAIVFAGLCLLTWIMGRAERRPFASYGLDARRFRDILPGAISGFAAMCVVAGILTALHVLVFDGRALHGPAAFGYGIAWLLAMLAVGCTEEYTFRGYLQYTLMRGVWGWAERLSPANPERAAFCIASVLTSLFFGYAHTHNQGETVIGIIQVVLFAIISCYALWRTGSLWWSIGIHALWDWTQSFLFGVADSGNVSIGRLFVTHPAGKPWLSGGSDGPEGSLIGLIVLATLFLVIHFTTRPSQHPVPEQTLAPVNPPQDPLPTIA
jgi:membrane protease YdiL (CAAX protease family)